MPRGEGSAVLTSRNGPGESPIAITGMGVLTPVGDDPAALFGAVIAGRHAIEGVANHGGVAESALRDFEATRYANIRGMRIYNRTTRLAICATKLALDDAGIPASGVAGEELGVVTASTYGHIDTLIEYDRSLVAVGLQRTNPALMPLAIPSAPGALVALSFGAKAFSITLGGGSTSSLDAVGLAVRLLEGGRTRACVVVGAFALCDELVLAASRAGLLAPADGFWVLDERSRGTALGEAAAAIVLETLHAARERGAEPKGIVRGHASAFASEPPEREATLRRACEGALAAARMTPAEIGLVSSGARGDRPADRAEAQSLIALLGETAMRTAVIAVKGNVGEAVDASGLLQSLVALSALRSRTAPPIARLGRAAVPGLAYATETTPVRTPHAMVTSMSDSGTCSALVLSVDHEL